MKKIILPLLLLFPLIGCYTPYPPVVLEDIEPNEEAFLIPTQGDTTKQTTAGRSTGQQVDSSGQVNLQNPSELRKHIVYRKQVQIPHRWQKMGYEWLGMPNGKWIPSAVLVKVDCSPVTREWTADPMSGTSHANEAVWVMTSDQVEFSTGWTCTARIDGNEAAVNFLSNYRNGSLEKVMDREIRSRIQTTFGLEVTDLPMDKLRLAATPHLKKVIDDVTNFFKARGITVTNLGITGGFVYKNKSVSDKLVEVFNAEQEKNVAAAQTSAQQERNKKIQLEAQAKAQALLTERKAEAEGILAVAEARRKETEVVKGDAATYMTLRRMELEKAKIEKWLGNFPNFYMNSDGRSPEMLLNVPNFDKGK